jgi:AhpD family alkylhydroperoxidase
MPRIQPLNRDELPLWLRLAYPLLKRGMSKLTGSSPEGGLDAIAVYAYAPGLLKGIGKLEQVTAKQHRVDYKLKCLAQVRAATMTNCAYCIDMGSAISLRSGLTEDQLRALPRYQESELFTEVEKLVLDYATGISMTPVAVSDDLFAALREHFDNAQLVELTSVTALENMRGRFNHALGIGAAGFSEGMACAAPMLAAAASVEPAGTSAAA